MNAKVKAAVAVVFSILLGCVFLFSAYTKTVPIEYFETTINSQVGVPVGLAKILARFFIGLEAGIGLLLALNIWGKRKWVVKGCIALTLAFDVYLILLALHLGNDINCGCMGSMINMSPGASLLKNAGLLVLAVIILLWGGKNGSSGLWGNILAGAALVIFAVLPFLIFKMEPKNLSLDPVYKNSIHTSRDFPDLKRGKHLLCFFSLTCTHCMHAATEISGWKKKDPSLPVAIVFPHKPEEPDSVLEDKIKYFQANTSLGAIPYTVIDFKDFIHLAGNAVPSMYWMNGDKIVRKVQIPDLNEGEFKRWLEAK